MSKIVVRQPDCEAEGVGTARRLIMQHGWNTTCYQILNPGIERWFSQAGDAVIGYVRRNGVRIVAGAPVCSLERLPQIVDEWNAEADRTCDCVCYFAAEQRIHALLGHLPGYSTVVLGAQPIWTPGGWVSAINGDPALRAQINRAKNKGVTVEEWTPELANDHPDLERVLTEWLQTRGLPTLHFLVEPQTLSCLEGRRIFVGTRGGRVVAFVNLSPVPVRNGWLTEQFVRGREASNGTIECVLTAAIEAVGVDGAEFVTMGIVPLSTRGEGASKGNPAWLRLLLAWCRAHGRRFYNFDGLDWFKSKFHPGEWEPIYTVSREHRFSVRTLYAVASAFSDGSPASMALRGLSRAARQEFRWAGERVLTPIVAEKGFHKL